MKSGFLLPAAFLALAACSGSGGDGTGLRADCITVANDVEGLEEIADIGTDPDGFCDCVVNYVDGMPEEDQTKVAATMSQVADGMDESGQKTEDVVMSMMSDAMANPDDPASQETQQGVTLIGEMFDDIADGFEDTGSCPAS